MKTKSSTLLLFLVAALLASTARAGTVNISLVPVGDPGNVADPLTGYGAVPYTYSMGEYDVTVGQYCQFLNAVAKTDTYGLYNTGMAPRPLGAFPTLGVAQSGSSGKYSYTVAGSYSQAANCPIFDVSWGDAARFVNWLANGQPTGPEGPADDGERNLFAQWRHEQRGADDGEPQSGQHLGPAQCQRMVQICILLWRWNCIGLLDLRHAERHDAK